MDAWLSIPSRNRDSLVRSEVLTAVVMKSYVFWDREPCSLLKIN
jgi:hypothetical protein